MERFCKVKVSDRGARGTEVDEGTDEEGLLVVTGSVAVEEGAREGDSVNDGKPADSLVLHDTLRVSH